MTENSDNKYTSSSLSKFNLVLIVVFGIMAIVVQSEHSIDIDNLYDTLASKFTVDFTVTHAQNINDVFLLSNGSQDKHLTGIKFSGRVINTQSVDHHNVVFNLAVDGKSKEFTINKISSGNSTGFNVYIPGLNIENARYAKIEYVRSQILFHTK